MPYAEGRVIHDADAHVVETPGLARALRRSRHRAAHRPIYVSTVKPGEESHIETIRARRRDPADRAHGRGRDHAAQELERARLVRQRRTGRARSICSASRASSSSTPSANSYLVDAEHGDDLDFAYGVARAHNRAMVDFCAADRRLLAVGYVPLADFDARRARWRTRRSRMGCKALMVPSACPRRHSPSHVGLVPGVGARAGGGRADRLPRRRRRAAARPALLHERPAAGARLPRRRRELPLRRLHGDPAPADADAARR